MGDETPEYDHNYEEENYKILVNMEAEVQNNHMNVNESCPERQINLRRDASTEEEDDDIEIMLSNARAAGVENARVTAVTSTLKAPKPAVVLTPAFTNPLLRPIELDDAHLTTNYPVFEYDIEKGEKPWKKPGADISDYFNYGFNEETWKLYCEKQRRMRIETASIRRILGEPSSTQFEGGFVEPSRVQTRTEEPVNFTFPDELLPPGIALNLTPDMSSSIAEMVASQLGLPTSFIAQLPPLADLFISGINAQTLFPQFFPPPEITTVQPPQISSPPADQSSNTEAYTSKKTPSPQRDRRSKKTPEQKVNQKSSRSIQSDQKYSEKEREKIRLKSRRDRSRSRERIRAKRNR